MEAVLTNDLSVAISFKESIRNEESLPHINYLFLDPKTYDLSWFYDPRFLNLFLL